MEQIQLVLSTHPLFVWWRTHSENEKIHFGWKICVFFMLFKVSDICPVSVSKPFLCKLIYFVANGIKIRQTKYKKREIEKEIEMQHIVGSWPRGCKATARMAN